jgi:hypothetical protein
MKARATQTRTTQTRGAQRPAARPGEAGGLEVLDRLIGDALVAAMILLGFALCLGAARAEPAVPAPDMTTIHLDRR